MKKHDKYIRHHVAPFWDLQIIGRKIPATLVVTVSTVPVNKKKHGGENKK